MDNLPLPKKRELFFSEAVDQFSIKRLIEDITTINSDDEHLKRLYGVYDLTYEPKPIKIYIDSYGGDVYSILGLIGTIRSSKTPVWTHATGAAMSAGFLLLISGWKRIASKYSTMMYHQLSSLSWGKLEGMKDDLKENKRLQKVIDEIVISNTKIAKKKLKEINTLKKDWFITSQEALELGIIDEII